MGNGRSLERELLNSHVLGSLSHCEMVFGWAYRVDSAVPETKCLYVN